MSSENGTALSEGGERRRGTRRSRRDDAAGTVAMVDFADAPIKSSELIVLAALFAAGADRIEKAVRVEKLSAVTGLPVLTVEYAAARAFCDAFAVLDREIVDDAGRRSRLLWIGTAAHDLADQQEWHESRADRERSLAAECRKLANKMKAAGRMFPFRGKRADIGRAGGNVHGHAELGKFAGPTS